MNVKSIPKEVCKKCLSVSAGNCNHKWLRGYTDFLCKKTQVNFLLCNQCPNHTVAQDWVKQNFDPKEGKKLLTKMRFNIPNYTATINLLHVVHGVAPEPSPMQ